MPTFLFQDIVFGPIRSRRFGVSLGINLLPAGRKICTFNCIYCECGWTERPGMELKWPERAEIRLQLERRLAELRDAASPPDHITFAGNGEPTMHPGFDGIVDDTVLLRDRYVPSTRIAALSNSSLISDDRIFHALRKLDMNVLKLDTADENTFRLLNQPVKGVTLPGIIERLKMFNGNLIIQTLFVRGRCGGIEIDNASGSEIEKWLEVIKEVHPESVMIYSIDRATPVDTLVKVSGNELGEIAKRVEEFGIEAKVY